MMQPIPISQIRHETDGSARLTPSAALRPQLMGATIAIPSCEVVSTPILNLGRLVLTSRLRFGFDIAVEQEAHL